MSGLHVPFGYYLASRAMRSSRRPNQKKPTQWVVVLLPDPKKTWDIPLFLTSRGTFKRKVEHTFFTEEEAHKARARVVTKGAPYNKVATQPYQDEGRWSRWTKTDDGVVF